VLTVRTIVFRLPVKNKRYICCPKRPDRYWCAPNLQFNGCRGTFVPWSEADHSTHLLVRLRMSAAMLPFLQMPSWCALEQGTFIMHSEPDDDHLLVDTCFYIDFHWTGLHHIVRESNYGDNNMTWVRRGAGARRMAVESFRNTKTTGCRNTEVISSAGSKAPFIFTVR